LFAVRLVLLAHIDKKTVPQNFSPDKDGELQRSSVAQRECCENVFVENPDGSLNDESTLNFSEGVSDVALIKFIKNERHSGKLGMFLIEQYKVEFAVLHVSLLTVQGGGIRTGINLRMNV